MKIEFASSSKKQLEKIKKAHNEIAEKIVVKIMDYADNPQGSHNVEKIKKDKSNYRLRVGDYRIRFYLKDNIMYITSIKHRQGAYND